MTSIPRDTAVHISGSNNEYDKINSAYTYGGTDLAVKTVEKTLDIPINFYMLINMGGLVKVIDDLGGVTVTPPLTFSYQNVSVTKGKTVKLDGKQALSYSRMRDDDPQGDYGRQKTSKTNFNGHYQKGNVCFFINEIQQNDQCDPRKPED